MRNLLSFVLVLLLFGSGVAETLTFESVFKGVDRMTSFAHDYGHSLSRVLYKGADYKPDEAARVILPDFGWADPNQRLRLGQAWVEGINFYEGRIGSPKFSLLDDGSFRYEAWATFMTGREPGRYSNKWEVIIDPQANLVSTWLESTDNRSFEAPGR